jgi:hypothetical protein
MTAVMMADANLTRPPNMPLSLLQAGCNVIARMIPHITGEIKGLKKMKQSAIKRAMAPIRIAMSIAGPMYVFSWVFFSASFIRIPPVDGCIFLGAPLKKFFFYIAENNPREPTSELLFIGNAKL